MGVDEAGTLAALNSHREDFIDPTITEHKGRIVKLMGDGALIEFPSVVDAVQCAAAIQDGIAARNSDVPADKRIEFRIGVNLGDIIVEGDDIYGDGVNVAARLQELCVPGGVAVSAVVFDQVDGKLDLAFDDLGEKRAKNIAKPLRVYSAKLDGAEPASADPSAEPLALPDKPSIAVLPFINMSGDPEQEYLADGITEDVITALAKNRWFFVIDRNSTFTYKGQTPDTKQVARELGVPLRPRRQRAQGRQTGPHCRPVGRRDCGHACLGRALRPRDRGYLRVAGRHDPHHRWGGRARTPCRRARSRHTQAAREARCVGDLSARAMEYVDLRRRRISGGNPFVSTRARARSDFRRGLCARGVC